MNDICLLRNDQEKRTFWKLCKVVDLIAGADGSTRSARIEVMSNQKGKRILNRSLKCLVTLEIRSQSTTSATSTAGHSRATAQPTTQTQPSASAQHNPAARPKRNAAVIIRKPSGERRTEAAVVIM